MTVATARLLFCLTLNDAMLGADMRRRALPINLHVEGPVIKRRGAVSDPKVWPLKHWLELVAELAGMVQVWIEAGRPMAGATASHTTSETWAAAIDAILWADAAPGQPSCSRSLGISVYCQGYTGESGRYWPVRSRWPLMTARPGWTPRLVMDGLVANRIDSADWPRGPTESGKHYNIIQLS